jgi:hypothetical protein
LAERTTIHVSLDGTCRIGKKTAAGPRKIISAVLNVRLELRLEIVFRLGTMQERRGEGMEVGTEKQKNVSKLILNLEAGESWEA